MLNTNVRLDNSQKYVIEPVDVYGDGSKVLGEFEDYSSWCRVWDNETETVIYEGTQEECEDWLRDLGIDPWQDVNWSDDNKYDEEGA